MKLHRVRLRNFRGVSESDVEFAEIGVTIVEGPNEVGKTSIADALRMAIEVKDNSKRASVMSVKPVDRDVGPEVEIELSSGQYAVEYKKRWLRRPMTALRVTAPQIENHTGLKAHERMDAILSETLDNEMWRALRIEQGIQLGLPAFTMPAMRRALERAAGGDFTSDHEDTLMERIREEYGRYWTLTGQKKGDRRLSEGRVKEAESEAHRLDEQVKEIEKDVEQMARLAAEEARIIGTRDDLEKNERDLAEKWASVERIGREVERLEANRAAAEARRAQAASEWDRRQETIADVNARSGELSGLQAEVEQAAPALASAIRRSEETADALRRSATALRDAEAKRERAIQDRDFLRQQIEVAQITERYDRYVKAEQTLKEAEDYLEFSKVDDEARDGIERAYLEDQMAKAATDSAAASVQTTALADIAMRIGDKEIRLAANEVYNVQVEDEVEFGIPGIARLRVSAGADAKGLAERRRRTHEVYRRLCEEVGIADLDEARRAAEQRRDALRNRKEARQSIRENLRDLTPDILLSKIEQLTERVTSYPEERPEEPPLPVDYDEAESLTSKLESLVGDCQSELRSREGAAEKAKDELNGARVNEAELEARRKVALSSLEEAGSRLEIARTAQSDEDLSGALALGQQEFNVSLKSLEEAEAHLKAADPNSLEARLGNARNARRRAIQDLESNRERQRSLQASLDYRGEQGLYGSFDEAESQLEQIRRGHERTEARAEAAKLLYETFDSRRRHAQQRYVEPLKECINKLGRIVFGPTFSVELNENLEVVSRALDGKTLDLGQLSTGTREQLGVLSRLACATLVSPDDGGAPVMIDDALGWSDPQRLQSMGAAIAAAGQQCQVVILTCTPGRYSYVGNAKVVTLIP